MTRPTSTRPGGRPASVRPWPHDSDRVLPALSRRAVIGGSAAALFLAACGSDDDPGAGPTTASTPEASPPTGDVVLVAPIPPEGFLAAGFAQRVPLQLRSGEGAPLDSVPDALTMQVSLLDPAGGAATPMGGPVEEAVRSQDVPLPYYPLRFAPSEAGIYQIDAEADGTALSVRVQVDEGPDVPVPQIGDPMPVVASATAADSLGVDPLCTRNPPCPFHEVSFADVVGQAGPTVLIVSTPAFCQTIICGPVLDLLIDEAPTADTVAIVHAEVYAEPTPGDPAANGLAPTVAQLGLVYEPTLFAVDGDGILVDRLDLVYDRSELAETLAAL